jgi:hypothetical protein
LYDNDRGPDSSQRRAASGVCGLHLFGIGEGGDGVSPPIRLLNICWCFGVLCCCSCGGSLG